MHLSLPALARRLFLWTHALIEDPPARAVERAARPAHAHQTADRQTARHQTALHHTTAAKSCPDRATPHQAVHPPQLSTQEIAPARMCMHRQVELQRTFKFKHSGREWTGIPLIVANMDTVRG